MTRVKICGITNYDDAACAAEAGADALGFQFAESPRRIEPLKAWEILSEVGPYACGVGVFVNSPVPEVVEILECTGCCVAQLHGDEPAAMVHQLSPHAVVKVIRVNGGVNECKLAAYRAAHAILLDTYVPGLAGGTGKRFDWEVARGLVTRGWRIIVAGGLTPDNVAEVVQRVHPYGVDVSSGVERAPGRKDHGKVREFIAAVRAAEA